MQWARAGQAASINKVKVSAWGTALPEHAVARIVAAQPCHWHIEADDMP